MRISTRALTLLVVAPVLGCAQRTADVAAAAAPEPVIAGELPLKLAPRPTQPAITAADLMTRVYIFADDSMQGREAGTPGAVKGTDYIAAELQRLGLEPAGDNGSFFQAIPLVTRGVRPPATLSAAGGALTFGTDFLAIPSLGATFPFGTSLSATNAQTVYGGRAGDTTAVLTPRQVAGKIVVLAPPVSPTGAPSFQFWVRGGLNRYAGAAAVAIAALDISPPNILNFMRSEQEGMAAEGPPAPAPLGLLVTRAAAERMLGASLDSVHVGASGRTVTGAVGFGETPVAAPARNVIAILRGRDPQLRNQYVALGAHNDHVGTAPRAVDHDSLRAFNSVMRPEGADSPNRPPTTADLAAIRTRLDSLRAVRPSLRPDSIYNGADDDASGSMTVLEIAQAFATQREKPRRSIIFVWHTGEEKGLYGADWFTEHPTVPRDSIVAQLNMDMVGRGGANDLPQGGPGYLQLIGSRRLSTELGDLVETTNTEGQYGFTFDYAYDADGHPSNYYCRSDHYMYARYGIPVVFLSAGGHRDYHQLTDEPQYINYSQLTRVALLVKDIAQRVADRDQRVVVDKPKPDPTGSCRQ